MEDKSKPARHFQPLRLLRNVRYPTYQLYATAGHGKTPPLTVLTIAVLETLSWLRDRFRDFEVPLELKWPEASDFASVDPGAFSSFRIDMGYKVEVVWLPEEKIWTLQLTEPDLGPDPGAEQQNRQPVPGRLFETNIAYRIVQDRVECGFRTIVSDIEGTQVPCEVYRLAIIKNLANHPLVGLQQGWPLSYQAHPLDRGAAIDSLQDWLKDQDRMEPAVIIAECAPQQPSLSSLPSLDEMKLLAQKRPSCLSLPVDPPKLEQKSEYPLDVTDFAHYKMGYAQIFVLPLNQLATFRKVTGQQIEAGDIQVIEPLAFGGDTTRFAHQNVNDEHSAARIKLDDLIQNYPKNKPMTFGRVVFIAKAKEIEQANIINLSHSKEDILRASEKKIQAIEQHHQEELHKARLDCDFKENKNQSLKEELSKAKEEKAQLRQDLIDQELDYKARLDEKDAEIQRLVSRLNRPDCLEDVASWLEKYYSEGILLHQRAKRELLSVSPDEVNLSLLCDALEYLATDYRDELLGLISEEEKLNRCSRKYDRPFIVTPVKGVSVGMYPSEYKIKYGISPKGKLVETPLDLHLKVGDKSDNLLRIYFLYDKETKQIVIGSLPKHLSTDSYK